MIFFKKSMAPFFTYAALIAIICPMYLVGHFINNYTFSSKVLDILSWHGHEMLYTYTTSILIGFLFTAAKNWTGKSTTNLQINIILFTALLISSLYGIFGSSKILFLIISNIPILWLLVTMLKVLRGNRNFYFINLIITLIFVSKNIYLSGSYHTVALTLISFAIFLLLFIFSGRLITFFTNNFVREEAIKIPLQLEKATLVSITLTFMSMLIETKEVTIFLALISFVLFGIRSYKLTVKRVIKNPLFNILLIGNYWLLFYLVILLITTLYPEFDIGKPLYHSLFTGALTCLALGIMTRASLGHNGLKLEATLVNKLSFLCVTIGSILRVFVPMIDKDPFTLWLHISMGFWTLGFVLFLFKFLPVYIFVNRD